MDKEITYGWGYDELSIASQRFPSKKEALEDAKVHVPFIASAVKVFIIQEVNGVQTSVSNHFIVPKLGID